MFNKYRSKSRVEASINMTPMIDVVFLLLAFFMVTSTYIQTSSLNVNLPKAKSSDAASQKENILTISKDGTMQWNGVSILEADITQTLQLLKTNDPNATLIIQGDQDVPYNFIIQAMDKARLAGVERLSLATVVK